MLKEGIFNLLGGGIKLLISVVSIPILIYLLGLQKYGEWSLIFSFINVLILFDGGIGLSSVHFLSKYFYSLDESTIIFFNKNFTAIISVSCLLLIILVLFFLLLYLLSQSSIVLNNKNFGYLKNYFFLFLFSTIVLIIQQFIYGIFQSNFEFKYLNLHKSLSSIIQQCSIIGVAYTHKDLKIMFLLFVITSFISLIFSFFFAIKLIPKSFKFQFDFSYFFKVGKYSLNAWSGYFGSSMFSNLDKFLVSSIISIEQVGIYSAITNLLSYINVGSSTPIKSLTSHAAISNLDINKFKFNFTNSLEVNHILAFLFSSVFLFYFTVSNVFNFSQNNLAVIFASTIIYYLYSLNATGYYYLLGIGKVKLTSKIVLFGGLSSLIFIYFFGIIFGLEGCLIGNLGYILTIFLTFYSIKTLKLKFDFLKKIAFALFLFTILFFTISLDFPIEYKLILLLLVNIIMIKVNHDFFATSIFQIFRHGRLS